MSVIYIARTSDDRIKATLDVDCLPSDVVKMESFLTTADFETRSGRAERFFELYSQLRIMESIGFEICLDFDDYFYETGAEIKLPHSQRVP
jgi:hypothetical protein